MTVNHPTINFAIKTTVPDHSHLCNRRRLQTKLLMLLSRKCRKQTNSTTPQICYSGRFECFLEFWGDRECQAAKFVCGWWCQMFHAGRRRIITTKVFFALFWKSFWESYVFSLKFSKRGHFKSHHISTKQVWVGKNTLWQSDLKLLWT